MNPPIKELMSVDEFLQIYSISRSVYFDQVKKGFLLKTQLGRRTYIKRSDADIWLSNIGK